MKRIWLIIAITTLLCSGAFAQTWSGWFLGASGDVFWDKPAEQMFSKPRMQLSKVFQVGLDPFIVSMPGLAWRTVNGEVGAEVNVYHRFLTHGNWQFLGGGGVSPIIVKTAQGGDIANKGSVSLDLLVKYGLGDKFGFLGGLKVDWQAPYSSTIPENEDIGTVVTLTLGVNADAFGF